jgi:transposase
MSTLKERRDLIKNLWKRGLHKVSVLQKTTGFSKRTLYDWVKQLKETNDLKQRSCSGRPKLLTPTKRCYLGRVTKSKRLASSAKISETLQKTYPGLNIAPRTVRENLQKLGYRVCIPRPVLLLTKEAMIYHVNWAKAHQKKRWNNIIFSDESTFQMFCNTT